jgi:hypothetical protein
MSADDAAQRKLRAEFAAIAQDVSKCVGCADARRLQLAGGRP